MRRAIRRLLLGMGLLWVCGALIVMCAGPRIPDAEYGVSALAWTGRWGHEPDPLLYHRFLMDDGGALVAEYGAVRYALDRRRGDFPLAAEMLVRDPRSDLVLREFALATTERADAAADDPRVWVEAARVRPAEGGLVSVLDTRVPAHTQRCRLEFAWEDGTQDRVAFDLPRPTGVLERLHEALGMWPVFRWLPAP